jgi:hypothetical protein
MSFAYVNGGSVHSIRNHLRFAAQRQDTGQWVMNLDLADSATREACGWYDLIDAARPADTATHTSDRSLVFTAGVASVVWVVRPWTADELTAQQKAAAAAARTTELTTAIDTLRQWASQSRSTTVTSGNAVATLQTVVNRLGTFFDRFADLLENQYRP